MNNCLQRLHDSIISNSVMIANERMHKVIQEYTFLQISENYKFDQNHNIFQNFKESKIIIIDQCLEENSKMNDLYFLIGFKKTVILVKQFSISFLNSLFTSNSELTICFLSNTKDIFDGSIKITYKESKSSPNFENEIFNFNYHLNLKKSKESANFIKIWLKIQSCISGYLIKQSYSKLTKDRITKFYSKQSKSIKHKIMKKDEFFELCDICNGSYSWVKLIYHIEKEKIYAIKTLFTIDEEAQKTQKRELENYFKIRHPFIPKFYGTIANTNNLIFEFIDGQALSQIKIDQLSKKEKFTIIFQLLSVFKYLHENNFVYRDLKPDNIMIDSNLNLVLIDFDRLLNEKNAQELTRDLSYEFVAPEIGLGILTNKSDIYSIGKIIDFLFTEDEKCMYAKSDSIYKQSDRFNIALIISECTVIKPEERPSISDLFENFCSTIIDESYILDNVDPEDQYQIGLILQDLCEIKKAIQYFECASKQNHQLSQLQLGLIYQEGTCIQKDIYKSIHYYLLASNQNNPYAQFCLGHIYYDGIDIEQNLNKAIHYLSLAANQNNPAALLYLGWIYGFDEKRPHDVDKAIHYYKIASDLNIAYAQYQLGQIYFSHDINKAIHYFSLAANQNNAESQFALGYIFYKSKYVTHNINKSIQYFTLAASQNISMAQFYLGEIYYDGIYVDRDINKSIHFLTLALKQNNVDAIFKLGSIYYKGIHVKRDIEKSIYYFTLAYNLNNSLAAVYLGFLYLELKDIEKALHYYTIASNLNCELAQVSLGILYIDNKYIKRDINKSIYYFTLASNQNNRIAQLYLGIIYYYGFSGNKDICKSLYYLSLSSNQNLAEAQFFLGKIYYDGKYVKENINKAIDYLSLASNQNKSDAQYLLGVIYYSQNSINKSIHYLTQASKQNHMMAQFQLGLIYYLGKYIPQDINRSIHYFLLASNQNYSDAQFALGYIYFEDKYIPRDINKYMYYFQLASNQNNPSALSILGYIYYINKDIPRDINKSINYLTLASQQNDTCNFNYDVNALYLLGFIFYEDRYIKQDINKSIHYLSLASIRDHHSAQFLLGYIYYKGILTKQNIYNGITLFTQSSKNGNHLADFVLGYIYHEGKYVKRDFKKSISFYKNASSFNSQYAKNNLGILYKNGYAPEIRKNIEMAKIYFNESIQQKNNKVSMYNLSHLYIFEEGTDESINKSIDLLIKSSKQNFRHSKELLSLVLVKKHGNNYGNIELEFKKYAENSNELAYKIIDMIKNQKLYNQIYFAQKYLQYKIIDFLYDYEKKFFKSYKLSFIPKNRNLDGEKIKEYNINSDFYEGFKL